MLGWWRTRSKSAKRRIGAGAAFVALVAFGIWWMAAMPGKSHEGPPPPLDDVERSRAALLRRDVDKLAGEIGERNLGAAGSLDRAWAYIERAFYDAGYDPKRHPYKIGEQNVANVEAVLKGKYQSDKIVVVGAHYDSAPGAPGADDNASGVAALLALARVFENRPQTKTVRFVAFTNEEPPHFWTSNMGSLVYAKSCQEKGEDVVAMLSLESLGYFRDEPGTQKYPPVVGWFYPDRGDFVAFVGDMSSRGLVREAVGAFRSAARVPSVGGALPSFIDGVGWSDHWSFWKAGYSAVMVTDTAVFRNPHYHTAGDRPDTLDYDRLSRIVSGLVTVIEKLAQ